MVAGYNLKALRGGPGAPELPLPRAGRAGAVRRRSGAVPVTPASGSHVLHAPEDDTGCCSQWGVSAPGVCVPYCTRRPVAASCRRRRRGVMIPWLARGLLIALPFESADYHE